MSQNRPILCLHSSGLSGAQWSKLSAALPPSYQVQTPDLLGYGSCQEPFTRPFHFHQDLERLQAGLKEPTLIIGHSYGGFLALQLALRKPSLVEGLLLFDPIAWGALESRKGALIEQFASGPQGELPRFLREGADPEEWVSSFVEFWGEPGSWQKISARARQSMLDSYPKMSEEVGSLVFDHTPHSAYQAIACPTLLIGGRQSPPQQREVMEILHRAIPQSHLEWMSGGHMAPIAQASEFHNLVIDYLSKLPRP